VCLDQPGRSCELKGITALFSVPAARGGHTHACVLRYCGKIRPVLWRCRPPQRICSAAGRRHPLKHIVKTARSPLTAEPSIDSRIRRSRERPSRQSRLSPPLFPFTRILLSDFNNLSSQAKTRVLSCSRRPMSSLHRTSPSPLGNAKLPVYQTNLIPFPNTKEGGVQPARGLSPSLGRVRNQPPAIM